MKSSIVALAAKPDLKTRPQKKYEFQHKKNAAKATFFFQPSD
jgi:hypothetical protein